MKKIQKTDVADFIREKTENFEMKPPDHVWSNIQSGVGKSASMSNIQFLTKYKYMLGTIAISAVSVIIIAILTFNPDTKNVQKPDQEVAQYTQSDKDIQEGIQISSLTDKETIQSENPDIPVVTDQKKEEISSSKNQKPVTKEPAIQEKTENPLSEETETQEQELIKQDPESEAETESPNISEEKKKEYFINQSQYGKINKVIITNQAGEVMIDIVPEINSSNFLPIDISTLGKGTYIVHIHTNTEIIKKDLHIK